MCKEWIAVSIHTTTIMRPWYLCRGARLPAATGECPLQRNKRNLLRWVMFRTTLIPPSLRLVGLYRLNPVTTKALGRSTSISAGRHGGGAAATSTAPITVFLPGALALRQVRT